MKTITHQLRVTEKMSEHEETAIEITQNEIQRKKKKKDSEEGGREREDE